MKFSRRTFVSALALTGAAALPAGDMARRRLALDPPASPDEASLDLAPTALARFGDRLRGLWRIELLGVPLPGLPATGAEMVLDVAPQGRALQGFIGTPAQLRGVEPPPYRVLGDLPGEEGGAVSWRVYPGTGIVPAYEAQAVFDEVWDSAANTGAGSLSGRLLPLARPLSAERLPDAFVATKRAFPLARERIGLSSPLLAELIAPRHRLFHQLWHAARDKWHRLSPAQRNALRGVGWQPGPLDHERDARGPLKDRNGSGVDFFFMHRRMLQQARALQPLPAWERLPAPCAPLQHDRAGFVRYLDNLDGFSVPPAWVAADDDEYSQWLWGLKSEAAYHANFLVWESRYQDPAYLATLTLGQFGSEVELGMHDWLHMRWASVTRDPSSGAAVTSDRTPSDFSPRWFGPENDFLGDPFSSHVNPVFWYFHGWIDARIEDWYRAHDRYHPGEVRRLEWQGVPWFAPGRWVEVDDPWLGPATHGCGLSDLQAASADVALDVETMKLALRVVFSEENTLARWLDRSPPRPWYARLQP
ncbi:PvdJ/PvdD/PvdP-like protein [Pseudomonas sp. RIT-PI-S]|uniref:pyoverdine maturation tyrosinase PvdP n=1 Tax=Pseudomonas sp. RIT-PI-S TaxID=3035295 RepID=UPI0021DB65EC|nr:PvdJ/PvdD/PvdP-like protein [Pseudomonas sp. RIT-PI-S]